MPLISETARLFAHFQGVNVYLLCVCNDQIFVFHYCLFAIYASSGSRNRGFRYFMMIANVDVVASNAVAGSSCCHRHRLPSHFSPRVYFCCVYCNMRLCQLEAVADSKSPCWRPSDGSWAYLFQHVSSLLHPGPKRLQASRRSEKRRERIQKDPRPPHLVVFVSHLVTQRQCQRPGNWETLPSPSRLWPFWTNSLPVCTVESFPYIPFWDTPPNIFHT